jgi:hypothetical protein
MSMILGHIKRSKRRCRRCSRTFVPNYAEPRYCSRPCGVRWDRSKSGRSRKGLRGVPDPSSRKVERPPYEKLIEEIEATSYLAVGRKYGVSDHAVRKWARWYERQIEREGAEKEPAVDAG